MNEASNRTCTFSCRVQRGTTASDGPGGSCYSSSPSSSSAPPRGDRCAPVIAPRDLPRGPITPELIAGYRPRGVFDRIWSTSGSFASVVSSASGECPRSSPIPRRVRSSTGLPGKGGSILSVFRGRPINCLNPWSRPGRQSVHEAINLPFWRSHQAGHHPWTVISRIQNSLHT